MTLVWLARALNDRDAQLDHIVQDNPPDAVSQGDHVTAQADMLLQHPQMGHPGRKPGTRELVIIRPPFIVVYRIRGQPVEVLRLLHGARKWPRA